MNDRNAFPSTMKFWRRTLKYIENEQTINGNKEKKSNGIRLKTTEQ